MSTEDTEMTDTETKFATQVAAVLANDKVNLLTKEEANAGLRGIHVGIGRKSQYALSSSDDPMVAEITYCAMYGVDIDYRELEQIADIFGSRKINLGTVEGLSNGCQTCNYGSRYRVKIFVIDPVLE